MVYNMVHLWCMTYRKILSRWKFFCGAHMHQKSTQGAQNIVHQNLKFFKPCFCSCGIADFIFPVNFICGYPLDGSVKDF